MKRFFVPILTAAVLAVGCNKTNEVADPAANPETRSGAVQEPLTFSDATLSFASMEEMNETIGSLASMNQQERDVWFAAQGDFVSAEQAAEQVIKQLANCPSIDQMLTLRNSYMPLFIFNPDVKEIDMSPYFKYNKSGYQWVCNVYGDVMIGGIIVNLNDISTFDQTWVAKTTKQHMAQSRAVTGGSNAVHAYTNDRKMWVDSDHTGARVFLKFRAQKKVLGVWHSYSTFYVFTEIVDLQEGVKLAYEGEYDKLFRKQISQYRTGDLSSGTIQTLGYMTGRVATTLFVYSNGVGPENTAELFVSWTN